MNGRNSSINTSTKDSENVSVCLESIDGFFYEPTHRRNTD